ncbi:MAG: tRNA (guanine(10)-N(2))-dimethyltransferase [Candidatus Woesearchaeota archaeon]
MDLIKITEGNTKLYVPDNSKYNLDSSMPVFFNPVMKLNRDITIEICKKYFKKNFKFLDLLSASGSKGIRILNEVPNAEGYFNDINKNAVSLIKKNLKLNKLDGTIFNESANKLLESTDLKFDFIDIDPFGTPVDFLESSIKKLNTGGLIGVTATDTSALVGTYPKACLRKYQSINIRTFYMFEVAIRILIKKVLFEANKIGVNLVPIFSHSSNHYVRVYFKKIRKSNSELDIGILNYCESCFNYKINKHKTRIKRRCSCGNYFFQIGPLFIGKIYDSKFVNKLDSINKTIDLIKSESLIDSFGYYDYHKIAKKINKKELSKIEDIIKKLEQKGYSASRTHFSNTGIKTDIKIKSFMNILSK